MGWQWAMANGCVSFAVRAHFPWVIVIAEGGFIDPPHLERTKQPCTCGIERDPGQTGNTLLLISDGHVRVSR